MVAEYQQLTEKLFSCLSGDRETDETKPGNTYFSKNASSPHNKEKSVVTQKESSRWCI